jgi:hypothetical protein
MKLDIGISINPCRTEICTLKPVLNQHLVRTILNIKRYRYHRGPPRTLGPDLEHSHTTSWIFFSILHTITYSPRSSFVALPKPDFI